MLIQTADLIDPENVIDSVRPTKAFMTASELLQQHFKTLVNDNLYWQSLIDDNIVWELAYAAAIGHPTRLSGRDAVVRHVTWF